MISENSKKLIEQQLKNVEVVQSKRKQNEPESRPDQPSTSADDLKRKYLSGSGEDKRSALKKKFLDKGAVEENQSDFADKGISPDHPGYEESDDDVEVGLIKNKNKDGSVDAGSQERTIIVSKNRGMLGSQG